MLLPRATFCVAILPLSMIMLPAVVFSEMVPVADEVVLMALVVALLISILPAEVKLKLVLASD